MNRTFTALTAAFALGLLFGGGVSADAQELTDRPRKQPMSLEAPETRAVVLGAKAAFAIVDAAIAEGKWTPETVARLRQHLPAMEQVEIDALMLKIVATVNSRAVVPTDPGAVFP